jgi:hypothetical protein
MLTEVAFAHEPKRIPPIRCYKCGGLAHLVRRSPEIFKLLDGSEIWTFECDCGEQIRQRDMQIIEYSD